MKLIEVKGFTPHPKQKEIIDLCLDDQLKYIVCCTGRQFGKSFLGVNILLKWVLEQPNSIAMFVSPIYAQGKKVFDELTNSIANSGLTTEMNKSDLIVKFINGSIIYFRSAEREDNLRGYTLTHLIIDEAAFIKDDVWSTVLRPTTLVKGKKVLFLSTPKGKNWFYQMAMRGYSEDYPQYATYKASSFDTPFISQDELDEAKMSLPDNIYKQEILAEFIDDGGEVFSSLKMNSILEQYPSFDTNERYYAGLDFGRQNDYTVLIILNSKGEMVDFYRERQKTWEVIISEVVVKLKKWKPQIFVEVNSIGDVLFETIRKQYPAVQAFVTSNDSKQNIIEDLILNLNEQKLLLPSQDLNFELYREMSLFTYEYSPRTRKVRYTAPNGLHDDTVISLALANHALKKKINHGKYVVL